MAPQAITGPQSCRRRAVASLRRHGIALAPFERDDLAMSGDKREIAALGQRRTLAEELAPPALQRRHVGAVVASSACSRSARS